LGHLYQFLKLFTTLRALQDLFWAISLVFCLFLQPSGLFQTYFGPFLSIFGVKSVKLALNWSKISQKGIQSSTKGQNQLKKTKLLERAPKVNKKVQKLLKWS
jgi:hypothetical protein